MFTVHFPSRFELSRVDDRKYVIPIINTPGYITITLADGTWAGAGSGSVLTKCDQKP